MNMNMSEIACCGIAFVHSAPYTEQCDGHVSNLYQHTVRYFRNHNDCPFLIDFLWAPLGNWVVRLEVLGSGQKSCPIGGLWNLRC